MCLGGCGAQRRNQNTKLNSRKKFWTTPDQKKYHFMSLCRDFTALSIRIFLLFLTSHPQGLFGFAPDIHSLLYLKNGQVTSHLGPPSGYPESNQPTERISSRSPFSAPNRSVLPRDTREGKGFDTDKRVASKPSNGSTTFIDPTNRLSITYRQSQFTPTPKKAHFLSKGGGIWITP